MLFPTWCLCLSVTYRLLKCAPNQNIIHLIFFINESPETLNHLDYYFLDSLQFLDSVLRLTCPKQCTVLLMQPQQCYIQENCCWSLSEGLLRKPNGFGFTSFLLQESIMIWHLQSEAFSFLLLKYLPFLLFWIIFYIILTCVLLPGWNKVAPDQKSCAEFCWLVFTHLRTITQSIIYKACHCFTVINFALGRTMQKANLLLSTSSSFPHVNIKKDK